MKDSKLKTALVMGLALQLLKPVWAKPESSEDFLGKISEQLSEHEHSLSTLAYLKNYEKALTEQVEKGLKEKSQLIHDYQELSQNSRHKDLGFQERFMLEKEKRNISNVLQEKNKLVQKLEKELAHKKFKYKKLEQLFVEQERNFHHTVDGMSEHISQLTIALERQQAQVPEQSSEGHQKMIDDYQAQLATVRKMQGEIASKAQTINHYKEELGLKNKAYDQLVLVNRKLSETLHHAENKIDYLMAANQSLNSKLVGLEKDYLQLEKYADNLEKDFLIKETSLHGEIAAIQQQFQQYKLAMSSQTKNARYPASVIHESLESAKDELSVQIKKKLQAAKISMKQYSENMFAIVLDDHFTFSNDQKEIGALNQAKLNALITLISEELFTDQQMRDKLISFDIVGHASPWYNSAYIHPGEASQEAYSYNLDLSLKRAQRVSDALFSEDFGDFPYKSLLRQKHRVIGKSFSSPVSKAEASREMASQTPTFCGPFDCHKSRRVEIIFQLDSIETTNK